MSDALGSTDFIAVSPSDVQDSSTTSSSSHDYPFGQVRLYPDGQVRLYTGSRENSEVDAKSEEALEEEEEVEAKADPIICDLCGQSPCDWDTYGEELWEECNRLKEAGADNKALRFKPTNSILGCDMACYVVSIEGLFLSASVVKY